MAAVRVLLLLAASIGALTPWRRLPSWAVPAGIALVAVATSIVSLHDARGAGHDLAAALAFLLLAVPLAVLLDDSGFFAAVASRFGGGRHLVVTLWALAAATTIVFNLDAAVVLLTPLYVRIAERREMDVIGIAVIPALLASLASSVLPVSNLTNLIAAARLDLATTDFLSHLAGPSLVAIVVGGIVHTRRVGRLPAGNATVADEPVDARALRIGVPVVVFLLVGFTAGDQLGVPAWAVAAVALVGLIVQQRSLPWRSVPMGAAALALGLGVLAAGAAQHLHVERLLGLDGVPGDLATVGAFAVGSNAINNLPMLLVALPGLDGEPSRVWSVLLGVNLGPTLWVTGALSTLLWQATMQRLGHRVSARQYASFAARAGIPALVAATALHLGVGILTR